MNEILDKARRGGYDALVGTYKEMVLDADFWQALGKACKGNKQWIGTSGVLNPWEQRALDFYRINLTKGWDKAVEYLFKLTNNKDE